MPCIMNGSSLGGLAGGRFARVIDILDAALCPLCYLLGLNSRSYVAPNMWVEGYRRGYERGQ
jgi:hypothetical protein